MLPGIRVARCPPAMRPCRVLDSPVCALVIQERTRGNHAQKTIVNERSNMLKKEALLEWQQLRENLPILPHFTPIHPKARGSRYGACGIRIDGNPEFVRAVMSRLKDLIAGENHHTRLNLAWNPVDGSGIGKALDNADTRAECCYIRLYVRGHEGAIASGIFDRHLDGATEQYKMALSGGSR